MFTLKEYRQMMNIECTLYNSFWICMSKILYKMWIVNFDDGRRKAVHKSPLFRYYFSNKSNFRNITHIQRMRSDWELVYLLCLFSTIFWKQIFVSAIESNCVYLFRQKNEIQTLFKFNAMASNKIYISTRKLFVNILLSEPLALWRLNWHGITDVGTHMVHDQKTWRQFQNWQINRFWNEVKCELKWVLLVRND